MTVDFTVESYELLLRALRCYLVVIDSEDKDRPNIIKAIERITNLIEMRAI